MKTNMGTADRILRIIFALVIVGAYAAHAISGTLAIVLLIFAGVFIITSFISFCPLNTLFGISTCKKTS